MTDHAATARQLLALTDGHAASADSLAAIATAHALLAIAERLDRLTPAATAVHVNTGSHATASMNGWEYTTTTGPRKQWDDQNTPPEGHGWERNTDMGRDGWERFDYHEESYWRRLSSYAKADSSMASTTFDTEPTPDPLNTEPGWTAPATGTYQLSTGQEPRPICGAPNPDQPGMICGDVPNHYGVHDHLRTWWPAGHYPPGAEPCDVPHGSDTCRLYDGHPGPCNTTNDHRRS